MLEDRITPNGTFTPTTFADDPSKGFTLRQAISAFNADNSDPGGGTTDTIQLAAGTYTLSIPNSSGKHEQGNASGDLNINNTNFINPILTIQGAVDANGNPTTIIKQTQADRVFQILNQGGGSEGPETVIFKNLIIEGGDAQENGGDGVAAGSTAALGGGIMDNGGEAHVTLSNVVLRSNKAAAATGFNATGGGIFVVGDFNGRGVLSIQNSVIQNNSALGGAVGAGGGGAAAGGGVAASGGGVFSIPQNLVISPCNVIISNSALGDNFATGGNATGALNGASAGGATGGGVFFSSPDFNDFLTMSNCNLSDNHVTGGNASDLGGGGGEAAGGSIYAIGHSTTLNDCTSLGNTVTGGTASAGSGGSALGGGGYVQGTATIQSSNISNNIVTGGAGTIPSSTIGNLTAFGPNASIPGDLGGRATGGGIWASGAMTISGCNLSGSTLTGGNGTVNNSTVNRSGDVGGQALGGGAAVFGDQSSTITDSILSNNNLTGGNGNYAAGAFTGTVGGSASGGGVYVSTSGSPTPTLDISDSTLSGNFVTGGNGSLSGIAKINGDGGIPLPGFASGGGARFEAGSVTNLVNSTIADNQAIGGQSSSNIPVAAGGGLFFDNGSAAHLTNVTVVGNQASPSPTGQGSTSGGGIDNANLLKGTVTLHNTLVALNGANKGPDYNGSVSNTEHNLISVADGSSGFSAANGDLLGSELHFLNPVIGSLANNGGPTQTIALLAGSPAINAGDTNGSLVTGKFDQRGQGFARVVNGVIDIGAFEVQPPKVSPPLVIKPPPSPAAPPTLHTPSLLAFLDSLLGAVETGNGNGTWTVTDSLFGIPLFVSTYDRAGNLLSVTVFGINVTFLFA
jgi:hypothetical protein